MNNSRYIPSPEFHNMKTQLQLSRIESKRGYLNSQSFNNLPSDESPFNPIIYSDVQYSEPALSKTNRCLTKYENRAPNMSDIALYDTHIYDINAQNVPGLENNTLHKNLLERARGKIQQAHSDLLAVNNTSSTTNGSYNPYLPISETNQPPTNFHPVSLDERLTYHTNERPFTYESDRANMA